MFVAFFESLRYVGHFIPVAFLRIYVGIFYLSLALDKYSGDYLYRPRLAGELSEALLTGGAPLEYKAFIETFVIPNWQVFAYFVLMVELGVGLSYLLGFLVRTIALTAAILSFNFILLSSAQAEIMHKTFFAFHLTMAWIGAGRCLGFDYFFYKRQRGFWW